MLKSLFLEKFSVWHLNAAEILEVVHRSHTGESLSHTCGTNEPKKFFSHQIFSHFLKLYPTDFLYVDRERDDYDSC